MASKTYYCYDNDVVMIKTINDDTSRETLDAGVYSVLHSPVYGFYLKRVNNRFETPKVIFGDINKRTDHVLTRYASQDKGLGVLLTGDKGSGKSLFTTLMANKMIDRGLAVVVVSEAYHGDEFNTFIESIGECVLLFDEFAKVYGKSSYHNESNQAKLLSLFDGIVSGKRLTMVTENEENSLNEFLLNRPGRFMYHYKYRKLNADVITEFCDYHGVPEIAEEVVEIRNAAVSFSMDILTAIVSEYKLFGNKSGTVKELCESLNIDSGAFSRRYTMELQKIVFNDIEYSPLFKTALTIPSHTRFGESLELVFDDDKRTFHFLNAPITTTTPKPIRESEVVAMSEDEDDGDEIYITHNDLVYSSLDQYIYSVGNYVITTKITDEMQGSWARFLAAAAV